MWYKLILSWCLNLLVLTGVLGTIALSRKPANAQSQIVPDSSLGAESSRVAPLDNIGLPVDMIKGGAIRGVNLFHSFKEFNVGESRSAYFQNPSNSIQNILTRVTGQNRSEILGTLGIFNTTGITSNPNLYLINPNGIVFGKNSGLDIQGSFVGTTANALEFGNQGIFSATKPEAPQLLTINPSAFLFNQINAGAIIANQSYLSLMPGKSLALVGGEIELNGSTLDILNGTVELAGIRGTGTVEVNSDNSLKLQQNLTRANINISNSFINTAADNGGSITINADNLDISQSTIQTGIFYGLGTVDSQAGDITINTTGKLQMAPQSFIRNWVFPNAIGKGGNIRINTDSMAFTGFGYISASTWGKGNSGSVFVNANNNISLNRSNILSLAETDSIGNAGNVEVTARNILLTGGGRLNSSTFGIGNGGNVIVNASEQVSIDGVNSSLRPSAILSTIGEKAIGQGGNIHINTGSLIVTNGAQISTGVFGAGTGGNLNVNASKGIQITGTTADGQISSGLYSETLASGNAGDTVLNTSMLLVSDGAQINSGTRSTGKGGNFTIDASKEVLLTGTGIFLPSSLVITTEGKGDAGNLTVNTPTLLVQDGATLAANSISSGNAGNIIINANERASFSQGFAVSQVGFNATGKAGDISIYTQNLELLNSFIGTNSFGKGNAGNVAIKAREQVVINNSSILAQVNLNENVTANRKAGNIQINAESAEFNNTVIDSSIFGIGEGGNIILDIQERVNFNNSTVSSGIANSGQGKGGNINIDAGYLSAINTDIGTETQGKGTAGNISLDVRDHISLSRYSSVTSKIRKEAEGQAGNVSISTGSLEISRSSQVSSATFGQGNAGNIRIEARDGITIKDMLFRGLVLNGVFTTVEEGAKGQAGEIRIYTGFLELLNGGKISSTTSGVGNAGNIIIEARDHIFSNSEFTSLQEGSLSFVPNEILTFVGSTGEGNAGEIKISTGYIEALNSTLFSSETSGTGSAGKVIINATRGMTLNDSNIISRVNQGGFGRGGDVNIFIGVLQLLNSATIDASTFGQGDAGNVEIIATQPITVTGIKQKGEGFFAFLADTEFSDVGKSSAIFSTTGDNPAVPGTGPIIVGKGKGGDINITAPLLTVSDGAVIDARTFNNKPGGNINLTLGNLQILNGGQIFTTSQGAGDAGTININAKNEVNIAGTDPTYFSRLNRFPRRIVQISPNSGVYVRATDTGSAGNIFLNTPRLKLDNQGTINAESEAVNGGNIDLNVQNLLLMRRNSSISTNAGTAQKGGNGGNVNINSKYIVAFPQENSDISANAFQGSGGRVEINSQGIFGIESRLKPTNKSDITASSEQGISGVTVIDAPETNSIQNTFTELPSVIDTNALIANSCISRGAKREENSFTVTGSGALRNAPGDGLNSVYSTGDVRIFLPASQSWKKGDPIVEPQGLYKLPNGQLLLSRSC